MPACVARPGAEPASERASLRAMAKSSFAFRSRLLRRSRRAQGMAPRLPSLSLRGNPMRAAATGSGRGDEYVDHDVSAPRQRSIVRPELVRTGFERRSRVNGIGRNPPGRRKDPGLGLHEAIRFLRETEPRRLVARELDPLLHEPAITTRVEVAPEAPACTSSSI
jgi:hypothetical protein